MKSQSITEIILLSVFGFAFLSIGGAAYAEGNERADILTNLVNSTYGSESDANDLTEAEIALLARQLSSCQLTDEDGDISPVFMEAYGCEALIQRAHEEGVNKQYLKNIIATINTGSGRERKAESTSKH